MLKGICFLVFWETRSFENHESMLLTLLRPKVLCPFSHTLLVSKPILPQPLWVARKPVPTLTNFVLISSFFLRLSIFPLFQVQPWILIHLCSIQCGERIFKLTECMYPSWFTSPDTLGCVRLLMVKPPGPNAFLSMQRDRLLSVPLPSHSAHLADWGLFSGCFQAPHASHRHVWFLHVHAYCFSLLGSPVAAEAWDNLALCDIRDVLPRGCGWRDGEDHWLTLIMDSAWGLWLVPWMLPSWGPGIWPRRELLKGLGGKPRSTGDFMSHRQLSPKRDENKHASSLPFYPKMDY